jgi:hypothetical protein
MAGATVWAICHWKVQNTKRKFSGTVAWSAGSTTSMTLAAIDRRNNGVVSSESVEDSQNAGILPPDMIIWHQIRLVFFQTLSGNKALWLTRLNE